MARKRRWKRGTSFSFPYTLDDEREVEVSGNASPGSPGRTYGPPEKCYPPEGPEIEDIEITTEDGTALDFDSLSKRDRECIEERAFEEACEADAAAQSDADDRAYDDWKDRQMERRHDGDDY